MVSNQSEECIEVSAAARILGVSTTTIYTKLSGEWAPYKRKIRNLTAVNLAALTEEQREQARELLSKRENETLKEDSNRVESTLNGFESAFKDQIEILKAENARLERLLDEANARIGEKDTTITSLAGQLAELTERALKTTEQAQFLTAQAQAAAAALPEPEPEEEPAERGWFGLPKRKKKK